MQKKKIFGLLLMLMGICSSLSAQLNTERIMAIGRNALYFEDYVLSIQYFNQVIKIKPYMAEPYMYRAIAKTQLGDYYGAEKDCNESIKRNPFLPGVYYIRGFIYRTMEKYAEAEADFTRALEFSPENKAYLMNRADVRSLQEKYQEAKEDVNLLLAREPHAADLHFEMGRILLADKDTAGAEASFGNVVKYAPYEAAGWSARGFLRMQQNHLDSALVDFNKAIELGSKWPGDYINRGVIYYKKHDYRNALADYDEAIHLAPDNLQCYYNRGTLRSELGDYNNALADFDKVLEIDPSCMEGRYQHGIISLELRQWETALNDFDTIISVHPYFLPAYYLASQAEQAMGNTKEAFAYRKKAYDLEENKEEIQKQRKAAALNTDVMMAENRPANDNRKEFSARAAQDMEEKSGKYDNNMRGTIQQQYVDIVNEPNFTLTYYARTNNIRQTNYYHPAIEELKNEVQTSAPIKITNQEIALSADLIGRHFEAITTLSERIKVNPDDVYLYLSRAIEFAVVQDYASAIENLNTTLQLNDKLALAYFLRANLRYKLLVYANSTDDTSLWNDMQNRISNANGKLRLSTENQYKFEFEMILRDYDKTIELLPTFSFAYFNKANVLCLQKDFEAAIQYYKQAIQIDKDFAEAYYNLGLTQIFINQTTEGINNMGKAGELGIYQAYNLISRFQD